MAVQHSQGIRQCQECGRHISGIPGQTSIRTRNTHQGNDRPVATTLANDVREIESGAMGKGAERRRKLGVCEEKSGANEAANGAARHASRGRRRTV